MNENINVKSEFLKRKIFQLIDSSELPVSNVYFILNIILYDVEKLYYGTINTQLLKQNTSISEEKEDQQQEE